MSKEEIVAFQVQENPCYVGTKCPEWISVGSPHATLKEAWDYQEAIRATECPPGLRIVGVLENGLTARLTPEEFLDHRAKEGW